MDQATGHKLASRRSTRASKHEEARLLVRTLLTAERHAVVSKATPEFQSVAMIGRHEALMMHGTNDKRVTRVESKAPWSGPCFFVIPVDSCIKPRLSLFAPGKAARAPTQSVTSQSLVEHPTKQFCAQWTDLPPDSFTLRTSKQTGICQTRHDRLNKPHRTMQRPSNIPSDGTTLSSPSGAKSRQPPTPQAWLAVKEIVRCLYVLQELPLHDVKEFLEEHHDFRASERMYKDRSVMPCFRVPC